MTTNTWPPVPPPQPPLPGEPQPRRSPWRPSQQPPAARPPSTNVTINSGDTLEQRLLDQRIVNLSGQLDSDAANRAVASLALLDASGDDPIQMRLSNLAPHGQAELDIVLTLLDTLDLATVPIHATCLGELTGAAVVLLAAADRRTAGASTRLTLREPRTHIDGPSADVTTHAEEHRRQLDQLQQRLAEACQQPVDTVVDDMRNTRVLTADQARDYGLLDTVTARHPTS